MRKSAPAPPDYTAAAEAQGAASQANAAAQAWQNRPNQYSDFGSSTWEASPEWDPVSGQYQNTWSQHTNLNPILQDAAYSQMRTARGLSGLGESLVGSASGEILNNPIDWGGLPAMGQAPELGALTTSISPQQLQRGVQGTQGMYQTQIGDSAGDYQQRAEDAIYQRQASRLDPQWDQRQEAMRSQLYNQGLREGDEAFTRQMDDFGRQRNDAYSGAMLDAIGRSGQEASRMFGIDLNRGQFQNSAADGIFNQNLAQGNFGNQAGLATFGMDQSAGAFGNAAQGQQFNQGMQSANFANQNRQQALAEQMQRQGWNLNLIQSALTGQQVGMPQMPGFSGAGMAQAPDYLGAAGMGYQGQLGQFAANQAQLQGLMAGGIGLAGLP